jgi:D-3-phosphoglycerate dehydrogenase
VTSALVTASLTPDAWVELERDFGWRLTALPRGSQLGDAAREHADAASLVIEAEPVDAATIDAFPNLSLIACLRGSPVNVDIEHASARAIPVLHTPGRNAESVADLVFGLMYSCVRHIARTHHLIASGELTEEGKAPPGRKDVIWRPSDPDGIVPYVQFKGPELSRLTLGLLGFGAIGRRVAAKALALQMRVLVHDPFVSGDTVQRRGAEPVEFEELFSLCDVLSLHAPSQPEGPLVGERELALMKPTAYLINTARASVLDYDALLAALRDGRLSGAGLDVFPDEPLSSRSPLLELPNVTLTPHIGGASTNVIEHQSELLLHSLRALASGDPRDAFIYNRDALDGLGERLPAALATAVSMGRAEGFTTTS